MISEYGKYMKECIELAHRGEGFVSPNPLVGAIVLTKEGNLAGKGWHKKYGEPHAEVNAFKDAEKNNIDVSQGTIFVSLEPCSHYGKTPPCADLIIKKGIKKVVIGCVDPNPKVDGGGIKKLKDAGIEVVQGILEKECKELNEIFFKNQLENKPFIAIKTATTLDGKIATKTGSSKWITSQKAREQAHCLRNKYDAILTSSSTVLADNPSMTCRLKNSLCRNPVRIIVDSNLKTQPNMNIFQNDGTKVYVACLNESALHNYPDNVQIIKCPSKNEKVDLQYLVNELYKTGIKSILIEAGGILNSAFFKENLVDKVYQFVAPKILGDNSAKAFVEGFDIESIQECLNLEIISVKNFEPDILIEYKSLN